MNIRPAVRMYSSALKPERNVMFNLVFTGGIIWWQGHLFVAVNCAKFRGTATSQKREFRGHFAAKIDNFAAISRPKF